MESGQSPLHAVLEKEVCQLMDESNVRKWKSFKEIEFYVLQFFRVMKFEDVKNCDLFAKTLIYFLVGMRFKNLVKNCLLQVF